MTIAEFTPIAFAAALLGGFIGSLTGLGGGVIVTPVLTLFLGVDMRYAIGTSLIAVIATSSGAAAAYVRDGYSSIRIGMFLEIATTLGAVAGAFISNYIPTRVLAVIFGIVLLEAAWQASRGPLGAKESPLHDPLAERLNLNGEYMTAEGIQDYQVSRVKTGFGLMFGAGAISGLLGVGSGALKVIAMDRAMRIPFKVSAATSNFMIGVTAAASASLYLGRGYVHPVIVMPVVLGILAGSMIGSRLLPKVRVGVLRKGFAVAVGAIAVQMIISGIRGTL